MFMENLFSQSAYFFEFLLGGSHVARGMFRDPRYDGLARTTLAVIELAPALVRACRGGRADFFYGGPPGTTRTGSMRKARSGIARMQSQE